MGNNTDLAKQRIAAAILATGQPEFFTRGRCRSDAFSADDFFPTSNSTRGVDKEYVRKRDRAKVICSTCTVQDECLAYAIHNRIEDGIWGGATDAERRKLTIVDNVVVPRRRSQQVAA